MSDAVLVAIIMAVPPTFAVIWSRREAKKDAKVTEGKIDHVTDLANSRLTETLAKVESLTKEVAALRAHVTQTLPEGQTSVDVVPDPEKKK